jgi:hypothetical protein
LLRILQMLAHNKVMHAEYVWWTCREHGLTW